MPVSRCARLKNDRRGAKPGSTALPLGLSLSLSLSFFPFLLVFLHLDPLLSCHLSPSRDDALSFPLQHSKIESPSSSLQIFFFPRFLFSTLSSLLQDSLDSLGDYVSCYYSSRGTPPRISSSTPLSPFASFSVPSAPSMLFLIFGYRFIDLLSKNFRHEIRHLPCPQFTFTETKIFSHKWYNNNY